MFEPSIIFQRSQEGREEIKQKSHGLTQSERLVLIMVDGVSSCEEIRRKLPALTDDRFNRALNKLQQKELVLEVFMPVEGQEAEELDRAVIDRFLQQDPLDPVTIIMLDPEEELAGITAPAARKMQSPEVAAAPMNAHSVEAEPPVLPMEGAVPPPVAVNKPIPAMDEEHREMADSLAEEVRQRQMARPPRVEPPAIPLPAMPPQPVQARSSLGSVHWGYWMMGVGGLFIATYFIANIGN